MREETKRGGAHFRLSPSDHSLPPRLDPALSPFSSPRPDDVPPLPRGMEVHLGPELERPSEGVILAQWTAFFRDPLLSLPYLQRRGITGKVPQAGLRSLHWRVRSTPPTSSRILPTHPCLPPSSTSPSSPLQPLLPPPPLPPTPSTSLPPDASTQSSRTASSSLPTADGSTTESSREEPPPTT